MPTPDQPNPINGEDAERIKLIDRVLTPRRGMDKTLLDNAAETLDPNYRDEFSPPAMKKYRSHKVVEAFKIGFIREPRNVGEPFVLESRQPGCEASAQDVSVIVDREFMNKHEPKAGGYYVRYPDLYESWSPAESFETGYSELDADGDTKQQQWDFIDEVARMCHLVNREYSRAFGDKGIPNWDNATEEQRHSTRFGVAMVLDHPYVTPRELHESWLATYQKNGWRHGEVTDREAKTHKDLLPFDELPPEVRMKDVLFRAVVLINAGIDIPEEVEEVAVNMNEQTPAA